MGSIGEGCLVGMRDVVSFVSLTVLGVLVGCSLFRPTPFGRKNEFLSLGLYGVSFFYGICFHMVALSAFMSDVFP